MIQDGRTALICAAQACRVEAVRVLVTQQEKPVPQLYMRDKHGFTALMYASMRDYQTIARLILSVPSRRLHERDRVRVCIFAISQCIAESGIARSLALVRTANHRVCMFVGMRRLSDPHSPTPAPWPRA